jgi:hypothetical protein
MSLQRGMGIVTNGLQLYFNAGNAKSYPEAGTSLYDISRNGNNGTLISGAVFDASNGSLSFDSVNKSHVATNYTALLQNFTVCAWFKSTGIAAGYDRIVDKSYHDGFWMGRNSSTANAWGGGVIGGTYKFITLLDNSWHFISLSRNGTVMTVFGDGISNYATGAVNGSALSSRRLGVGATYDDGRAIRDFFKGNIANVFVYNRALSSEEIMQNFNATKGRFSL